MVRLAWLTAVCLWGAACVRAYPQCRQSSDCRDGAEVCVDARCQQCSMDAHCPDETLPRCVQLRCVDATAAVESEPEIQCGETAPCAEGLVCEAGRCSRCHDDAQCPVAHCDRQTGRCDHGPPPPQEPGSEFSESYRTWMLGRVQAAQAGNRRPAEYEPCDAGRYCALRWDMDWQLFTPNSIEVIARPTVVVMLAEGFEKDPSARVTLVGHAAADERDAEDLARLRAEEVRKWLVGEGLDPARLDVRSEGAARPVYAPTREGAAEAARRVEFLLSSDASPVGWWPRPRRSSP